MDQRQKDELKVQGIAASQGIAYGQIFVYVRNDIEVPSYLGVSVRPDVDVSIRFEANDT